MVRHQRQGPLLLRRRGWQRYTEDDGLASGSVEGVACTPDGTLWLDVIGGLTRFDGTAFEIIDPEVMGS